MTYLATPQGRRNLGLLTLVLLSHIIPTVVIGFGFVIPGSCIAGINEHTLGFISSIIGYIPTFYFGVYLARRLALAEAQTPSEAGTAGKR